MANPGVARVEIAESVIQALAVEPLDRTALISSASENGAREIVTETLARLPEGRRFSSIRELWVFGVKYISREQAGLPSTRGPGPFDPKEGSPMRSDYALKRFPWLKSKMAR